MPQHPRNAGGGTLKESRNEIKTGADSAEDLDRASKVPASEFVVAEEGRSRPHVN